MSVSETNGRDANRHAQGDRELAEQPPDDAGHEQKRNENRDERDAQRHDGESDLPRAFERGLQRRIARFDVTHDVLDHHNRVIDDEAGRDRQRHQGKIIEAESGEIHDAEGADRAPSGKATLGITVAHSFRRKRNITITTSATVRSRVN